MRAEIKKIQELMEGADYVTDAAIATSVHLAMTLKKPLLIEGHAGVGKTEVAKVISRMLETNLIRLQCYEGLDAAQALYDWDFPRQMLHLRAVTATEAHPDPAALEAGLYDRRFHAGRPLLRHDRDALDAPGRDEVVDVAHGVFFEHLPDAERTLTAEPKGA